MLLQVSEKIDLSKKRIMVTGGRGFLGRFVIGELLKRKVAAKNIFAPKHQEYDLTNPSKVKKAYQDFKPQIVIHLAGKVGGIEANQQNPGAFFYENLLMGIQLIEQARSFNVEKFVCVGTVCSYPKFTPVPFKEESLWNGYPEETNAPYGIAKKALLVQLQSYRQQYGFNGIYLIPVNLYGPFDHFDSSSSHVIPSLIKKFLEAKKEKRDEVIVWGTGKPTREFLYVEDAARAIILATEKYNQPEPINIGTGQEISITELAKMIARILNFRGRIIFDTQKPDGQPHRQLNVVKARKEFGFTAKTSLAEGLDKTISWYKQFNHESSLR